MSMCLSVCAHVSEPASVSVPVLVSGYVSAVVCLSTYASERLRVWEEGGQNKTAREQEAERRCVGERERERAKRERERKTKRASELAIEKER